MKIKKYLARDYANAMKGLLPPGLAWQWPVGGLGDALFLALAQELARLHTFFQSVLDNAINTHKPAYRSWHIDEYRRVANEAAVAKVQAYPLKYFSAGSPAGSRCWSPAVVGSDFKCPLVQVDHFMGPLRVGSYVGDRTWSARSRVILRVRYFKTVVDPKPIFDALLAFKQAHVVLWFEDITGVAGEVNYAQN